MAMDHLWLVFLATVQLSCADPCVDYIDIGHPQRSLQHITKPGDRNRCDYYVVENPGRWYRFVQYTGGRMPEECVPMYRCGTVSPIWMNGTHPTEEGVEVEATACANQGIGPSCCDWSGPMSVRMCRANDSEPFFVYQLPRPEGCSSSYCAGDKSPCKPGTHWDENGQMCSEDTTQASKTTKVITLQDAKRTTLWKFMTTTPNSASHMTLPDAKRTTLWKLMTTTPNSASQLTLPDAKRTTLWKLMTTTPNSASASVSTAARGRPEHGDGDLVLPGVPSFVGLLIGVLAVGIVVGIAATFFFRSVLNKRNSVEDGTYDANKYKIQSCDTDNITVSVPPLYYKDGILETKKGLGLDT